MKIEAVFLVEFLPRFTNLTALINLYRNEITEYEFYFRLFKFCFELIFFSIYSMKHTVAIKWSVRSGLRVKMSSRLLKTNAKFT